jgi:phosphoribosyl 1,2-cyclic phosphodiesterase
MSIQAIALQSGSNGNCIYVEAGGMRLLFDAGICGSQAEGRLAYHKRDIRQVNAVLISHDHADHIRYAGVYQRKYNLPVYMTPHTLEAGLKKMRLGRMDNVHLFFSGGLIQFGPVTVQTIPTMHDSADGSGFIISYRKKQLGILTDLGHVFADLDTVMASLDAVFIESNYDPVMLEQGPYPASVKKRIKGPGGHLSNIESAGLINAHGRKLKWACLAHLSANNNNPHVAVRTHRKKLNADISLFTASRHMVSHIFAI